ncbi:MAG TPA: pirin family protein [Alphaproteobacteria bacterium]|nr:pirin family protein [Alphaproteobacteria bacterium]
MVERQSDIEAVIVPRTRDLGDGFTVRRALPSAERRMVGPFVFFDQMGPLVFAPGRGLDVRPHPHIGLATVTYLFAGEILHRDSLGTVQPITPGAVNWMTAGRGIVHSERTPSERRATGGDLSGIQIWVALPKAHEETEPTFNHHAAEQLPVLDDTGLKMRVILGSFAGASSPVPTLSDMFYADAALDRGAGVVVHPDHEERAAYVVEGRIDVDGATFEPGQMLILRTGAEIPIKALDRSRVLLFGGEPMDGPRRLWWNFVASSPERIEQAKADWRAGRIGTVPGETEFIPLPEEPPQPVAYP